MNNTDDFAEMDDLEFFAERRRVREVLEHQPEAAVELTERYQRLNEEFLRRARIAWSGEQR
jgi:hypothetical protein